MREDPYDVKGLVAACPECGRAIAEEDAIEIEDGHYYHLDCCTRRCHRCDAWIPDSEVEEIGDLSYCQYCAGPAKAIRKNPYLGYFEAEYGVSERWGETS